MIKFAITIVHNKTAKQNEAQIQALVSQLTPVQDGPFINDETKEEYFLTHHELTGLGFPHEVKVYQVVPFGVEVPQSAYLINSGGIVHYGTGDEDKVGDHPRFFNWGLKRGTDNGAEAVVHLDQPANLDVEALAVSLNSLADPNDQHELTTDPTMTVASLKLLTDVGQLDETTSRVQAVSDLETRVSLEELKIG